ncbi:copper resistance CopC family protein [Micromonospora sp. NPDC003197]
MGNRGTRIAGPLLGAIVGLLCVLLPAGPAAAHNSLASSNPKDGAQLRTAPERVELTFLSRLDPQTTKVTVTGPEDIPAQGGEPVFSGAKVTVPFQPAAAGTYLIRYEVASGDGHPVKGTVRFTLTLGATPSLSPSPAPTTTPTATPTSSASPAFVPASPNTEPEEPSYWWVGVAGAAVLVGVVAILALRRRRRG